MRSSQLLALFVASASAARPFLEEPDTGIDAAMVLGNVTADSLPPLSSIIGLPDFQWAARNKLSEADYTYYRGGAAGEWSYRNNLEIFHRYRLRPRVMRDITNIESTLNTTILGYNFSAPFYISPCARGGLANPLGEEGLQTAARQGNILYIPALYATLSIERLAALKRNSTGPTEPEQITFQQVYLNGNDTQTKEIFARAEAAGQKAIVFTVDSAADGNRHRAMRYGVGSADTSYTPASWEFYAKLKTFTKLPIILKGIMTVEDARLAVKNGVPAIILSNHGGRQLDGSPSPLEVALEIYQRDRDIFKKTEVYADGGVRYGADVLKLLALGVKAVGLGRPFMYANAYGAEGVKKAIDILKKEIALDAANAGIADLKEIDASYVKWDVNAWHP